MATLRIQLDSMRPDLAEHLEHSVESVPHVQSVGIDIDAACLVVEHDGVDRKELIATLRDEGFEARFD